MTVMVCTITGHRSQRFKFKYNEHYKLCIKIKKPCQRRLKISIIMPVTNRSPLRKQSRRDPIVTEMNIW